jgi:hypothetical protein
MVLNSELKGQEKNNNFKIFFLKQNFASVLQVPRKALTQVLVFDIFCEKKNASPQSINRTWQLPFETGLTNFYLWKIENDLLKLHVKKSRKFCCFSPMLFCCGIFLWIVMATLKGIIIFGHP